MNQKGGVGKTTLCVNLASYWALRGASVLVVDADPQGSSLSWSAKRARKPLFPVIGMAKPTLHDEVPPLAAKHDVTLIDAPPRSDAIARSVIMASDLVLVPVQPSPFDVWASDDTVSLIEEARRRRGPVAAALLINRKISRTVVGRRVSDAFDEDAVPVIDAAIGQRIDFVKTAGEGLSVCETKPKSPAARDIARLAEAITHFNERKAA